MEANIAKIGEIENAAMDKGHNKNTPLHERIHIIKDALSKILMIVFENITYETEADEYVEKRDAAETPRMMKIQEDVMKELDAFIKKKYPGLDFWIKPQSSLSARTHLVGSSDIDYSVGVDDIAALKLDGFKTATLKVANPDVVVYKMKHDDVDFDFKIRDKRTYKSYIHDFMDFEMSNCVRNAITYIKYILSQKPENKDIYGMFKGLVYEWASIRGQEARNITPIEFLYELK